MKYPRVLVVALGRINAADNFNNGLLLRNLFGKWPRENLAQIYSSGDNGDSGFFGNYYQLGPHDRWLGQLFYTLKAEAQKEFDSTVPTSTRSIMGTSKTTSLRTFGKRMLMDTGLYELIFRPRLSRKMLAWVEDFQPDIIFAQGYNLTFTWLPLMLAQRFRLPLAYYPTDDWPNDLYHPKKYFGLSHWIYSIVTRTSRQLVEMASVRIAFNPFMQEEYRARYGKEFSVLMHGDEWKRFENTQPRRLCTSDTYWIVSTGVFNRQRAPLLGDLDRACEILNSKGVKVQATIFPVHFQSGTLPVMNCLRHVRLEPCPSHAELPAVLLGADLLFLPERFDETAQDIRVSVSSKAHLFIFSGKPIVVYSDPITGVARYAKEAGWAVVVEQRDPAALASAIERLLVNERERQSLVSNARQVAAKNHDLKAIQDRFLDLLSSAS